MANILLVEDNELNRDMLSRRLERKGHAITCAVDGQQGLDLARSQKPDMILMDIHLPDINGIAALAQIRAVPSVRKVPVIAVSASVMPEDQQQIIASGFDAYITKPLNMKSFLESVEKLLGGKSA